MPCPTQQTSFGWVVVSKNMISYKKQCLKYVYIYNKANHQFDDETVIRYYTPIISWNIHRHVQPPASYISSICWVHHIYLHHLLTNLFDQTLFRVKNWNHQPYATACYNQPYVSSSPLPRFPNSPKILGYQKIPTYVWKYGTPEIHKNHQIVIKLSLWKTAMTGRYTEKSPCSKFSATLW